MLDGVFFAGPCHVRPRAAHCALTGGDARPWAVLPESPSLSDAP